MLRKDPFIVGEYYHIYNRGIDKRIIFKLKKDYERFIMLLYLANSKESFRLNDILNKKKFNKTFDEVLILDKGQPLVSIGAWCLMSNHFHLLIRQKVDGGITKFMKKLGTAYSMYFNIKYQRTGSLFGGLFKSKLVGVDDNYMRQLLAYIHLNVLDINFPGWEKLIDKKNPREWKDFLKNYLHSSYQDYIGIQRPEGNILNINTFPDYFKEQDSFKDFIDGYLSFEKFRKDRPCER